MSWLASGTGPVSPADAAELLQEVVGAQLTVLVVGMGQVHLPFGPDLAISIEGKIRAEDAGGAAEGAEPVEPQSLPGLALLQPLLGSTVASASAHEGGALTLVVGGTTLRCDGDPYYEPWSLTLADGRQLTSTPGGGFVVTH
jgi:hypothetical protein